MDIAKINEALAIANQGQYAEGKRRLSKMLKREPGNAVIMYSIGAILYLEHNYTQAIEFLERSLRIQPDDADALGIAAVACLEGPRNLVQAQAYAQRALDLSPSHINSLLVMGQIHILQHKFDVARQVYLKILALEPEHYAATANFGVLLSIMGRRSEAIVHFRRAYEKNPDDPVAICAYLSGLKVLNLHDELSSVLPAAMQARLGVFAAFVLAITRYLCVWSPTRRLLEEMHGPMHDSGVKIPYSVFMQFNMLSLSIAEIDNDELFFLHRRAGETAVAMRTAPAFVEHPQAWKATRKWRIGYLSADFRTHSVSTFLRTLINEHDRDRFEVYCYSNTLHPDERTEEYKQAADAYVDITHLSDEETASRIRADGIHILVDLSGYTIDSRLPVLAYRPAPVQMYYLGYPYTTGMNEVDFLISDPYLDVPENAGYFTERHLCLPECVVSFGKMAVQPIVDRIPYQRNGHMTFGTLGNIYKITPDAIAAWSSILDKVPASRMIINNPALLSSQSRQALLDAFASHGIAADRITLIWEKHPANSHFYYYNDIDIALDTFPLTGGTTTADALWMGVPVITLVGDLYHKRISYSIINNVGLAPEETVDWCATCIEEYVAKAVKLANDPERIARLRQLIPEKLKTSILTDQIRWVRQIEDAYVRSWTMKFQDVPVESPREGDRLQPHRLAGTGVEIFTSQAPDDRLAYVLEERGGQWYEAEWPYLQAQVSASDEILLVGAGAGIYALPLARKAGSGRVHCVCRKHSEAVLLGQGIDKNQITNIRIVNQGQRKFQFDHETALQGVVPDYLILQGDFSSPAIFEEGEAYFAGHDPLIMFSIHKLQASPSSLDTRLIEAFITRGYHILRLLPGLGCLVPIEDLNEVDVLVLNLFACKTPCAERLVQSGRLVPQADALETLPGIHETDWQTLFAGHGCAGLLPVWGERPDKPENWEVYWVVLNLYARSLQPQWPMSVRYGCLKTATQLMSMLNTTHPTPWRLASQSVLCQAMGWQVQAVRALDSVCAALLEQPGLPLDEPCLLLVNPLSAGPAPDPDDLHAWLIREAFAQRERLRTHTSYDSGDADLPLLDELDRWLGLPPDLERRRCLIRRKHSGQIDTMAHSAGFATD